MVKPLCGLFNQSKHDAPIRPNSNTSYTAITTSMSWRIQTCQIKCDILSLDNSLDNSHANHLLGGNTSNIIYDTYI